MVEISSVSIVTRPLAGRPRFGHFLTTTVSRPVLWPTQPLILSDKYRGIKRPRREGDHLRPSSAEVKNAWSYTSTSPVSLWRGA
jgi:hypothetical protein